MGSPVSTQIVIDRLIRWTIVPGMVLLASATSFASSISGDGSAAIRPALAVDFYQELYFGIIVPSQSVSSTVQVLRGSNNSSICGAGLTCLEPGNRARYLVTGAPGHSFSITDPGSIFIDDGNGNSMLVDLFVGAGSGNDNTYGGTRVIRPNGTNRQNIGATLHINPNQPAGFYSGSYTITANYE